MLRIIRILQVCQGDARACAARRTNGVTFVVLFKGEEVLNLSIVIQ